MRRKTKRKRHLRGKKCVWSTLYARCRRYWCCRYRKILATVRTTYYLIEHAVQFDGYFMLTKNWQEEIAIPSLSRSATSCARWAHCFTTKHTNTRTHMNLFSFFEWMSLKIVGRQIMCFTAAWNAFFNPFEWMNEWMFVRTAVMLRWTKKTNNNNKKIHTRFFWTF